MLMNYKKDIFNQFHLIDLFHGPINSCICIWKSQCSMLWVYYSICLLESNEQVKWLPYYYIDVQKYDNTLSSNSVFLPFLKLINFDRRIKSLRLHTKNSSSKAPWTYKIILGKMNQKATFHYRRRLWCCRTSRRKRGLAQSDRVQRKTEAAGSGPSTQTLSVSSQSWRGRPE